MKHFIQTCINPMIPNTTKKVRGKPFPWLNDTIRHKMDQRDQLYRKSRKSRSRDDTRAFIVKKAKAHYHKNLMRENENKPDKFWSKIKKLYPSKTKRDSCASFQTENGSISELKQISNGLSRLFSSIINSLKVISIPLRDFIDLSKAFDTLSHGKLLSKLTAGNDLERFTDYLFNRQQFVVYNGVLSEKEYLTVGVPHPREPY